MIHIIEQPGEDLGMFITKIYKPDSTSDVTDDDFIPQTNMFYQNYPNPFNPSTHIKFSLIEIENVSIRIYDILGKEIKLLLEKNLPAGEYHQQHPDHDTRDNHHGDCLHHTLTFHPVSYQAGYNITDGLELKGHVGWRNDE